VKSSEAQSLVIDRETIRAERLLLWVRFAVAVTGTAIFPFVADEHVSVRWIAYALLAAGWVQGICGLCSARALELFVRRGMTRGTTIADATLSLLWLFSTGGVESPWFVALYVSILWTSLRRPPRDTVFIALFIAAGYLGMAVGLGQVHGHVAAIVLNIQFMVVVAVGSAVIARERIARLRSRIALLDLTQEVGQIGTWEWSVRNNTLTWSDELYRIFGVPRSVGPTFERYVAAVHPDDRERVTRVIQQATSDKQAFHFDHRIVTPDGNVRSLDCRGRVVLGADGEVQEMVGSSQDVTERRKMEAQLLLAGKLASLGTLASGIAHEINNPLAYVSTNLELIERQLPEVGRNATTEQMKPLRDAVTAARHGSSRMRDIVQGLNTFSRADHDKREPIDLAAVADLAIDMTSHEITQRARLVRDYSPTPPVIANESRLSQVLMNLLVNASQAIERGAVEKNEIRVQIRTCDDGSACIEVSDTGSGVVPENVGRIFDPFFTTKTTGNGTGLGLSICHGIVRDLGGEIRMTATSSKGTTFRVSLPVVDRAAIESARPAATSTSAPARAPNRRRICIVDDEARYAESLRLLLGHDHDVTLASNADRALELLSSGASFDVILCDLMMPGKTGMDFYDDLSKDAADVRKRIVFITGGATNDKAREFLARPDIRYVEKPVELEHLHVLIDEVSTIDSPQA
jgi:PAS domain S-box-containing protein